ncbi:MAG: cytochrome c oxidase subunit I, partial [Microcystaceae cyanobacterium]
MTNIPVDRLGRDDEPEQTGWKRYFSFSTDHKVIGVQYLVTAFIFFLIGGLLAMIVRAELLTPQLDIVDRALYNGLFTMHGTVMIFLWIFPANVGLANYLVPLMIGARDVAFPVLNAIAFWLIPVAGILLLFSFFLPSGTAQAGWWSYPPVSIQNPSGHLINGEFIWLLAVAISGVSSIMGGVNFVTTIVRMRAPGMTFFRMPVYVWTNLSAQLLQLFCLPALTGAAIMLLFDLSFGTGFFAPFNQGDPIVYQHLFWFYSHPAVYVMALPAFGVFSEVIPAFARKPLFGYKSVAISSLLIAGISTLVWVHHMFASATPSWMRIVFMFSSM